MTVTRRSLLNHPRAVVVDMRPLDVGSPGELFQNRLGSMTDPGIEKPREQGTEWRIGQRTGVDQSDVLKRHREDIVRSQRRWCKRRVVFEVGVAPLVLLAATARAGF